VRYRQRYGSNVWHFCSNCDEWPRSPDMFNQRSDSKPTKGVMCEKCAGREKSGDCAATF